MNGPPEAFALAAKTCEAANGVEGCLARRSDSASVVLADGSVRRPRRTRRTALPPSSKTSERSSTRRSAASTDRKLVSVAAPVASIRVTVRREMPARSASVRWLWFCRRRSRRIRPPRSAATSAWPFVRAHQESGIRLLRHGEATDPTLSTDRSPTRRVRTRDGIDADTRWPVTRSWDGL